MLNKLEARLATVKTKPKRQGNDERYNRGQQCNLAATHRHRFFIAADQQQHESCTNQR